MKFVLPIFCCLMFNVGYAVNTNATQQRTYDPSMTQALQKLLPDYQRHLNVVRFLVRKQKADPSELLLKATKKDDWKTMSFALQNGAAANYMDETTQRTALQLAQSKQAAELLLADGANAGIVTPDNKTVLQIAVEELKPFSLLHVLCREESIDMNHKDSTGNTAAHMLFLSQKMPQDITNRAALLNLAGADFDVPNTEKKTAQDMFKARCSPSQARRIKRSLKQAESFQSRYARASQRNSLAVHSMKQVLQEKLPDPLIGITTGYAHQTHLGKKDWTSYLKYKQRTRSQKK